MNCIICKILSNAHVTFDKINHMLNYKPGYNKFEILESFRTYYSDNGGVNQKSTNYVVIIIMYKIIESPVVHMKQI